MLRRVFARLAMSGTREHAELWTRGGGHEVKPRRAWLAAALLTVVVFAIGGSPASAGTYGGGALTVTDQSMPPTVANPYPSVITVAGGGVIQDLNVRLFGVTHDYPEDLDALLVGPGGQQVILVSDVAEGASVANLDVTLDDEAGGTFPDQPVTRGLYKPTDNDGGDPDIFPAPALAGLRGTLLSTFDNTFVEGDWRLFVTDDTTADGTVGTIGGWVLTTSERSRLAVNIAGGTRPESGVFAVVVYRGAGGLAGQVDFSTSGTPGTFYPPATPGADYVPTSGTITFGPGETVKSFDVQMIDDTTVESVSEAVPITLSNPRGDARLGLDGTYTGFVTISDNDHALPTPLVRPRVAAPRVSGATTQHVVRQRMRVRFTARSSVDGVLNATGAITVPHRKKLLRLNAVRVPAKANVPVKLSLVIRKMDVPALRRALARYRKVRAVAFVRVEDAARTTSRTVTFRMTLMR
jgi:subtilisin-like proprotein convertase family protein